MTAGPTFEQTPQRRRHWSLILPHAPLPEALAICLDMVGSGRYERAAISWHTRFCGYAPSLTFSDAQAALAALAAFPDARRVAAAAAQLAGLSRRYGLNEVAEVVDSGLAAKPVAIVAREQAVLAPPTPLPSTQAHHPTAA
jgi:hypothetical protein